MERLSNALGLRMAAEATGRFGVRGAVTGFVVRAPDPAMIDRLRQLKADCRQLADRIRAGRAIASPAALPVSVEVNEPIAAGPDFETTARIASAAPLEPQLKRRLSATALPEHYRILLRKALAGFAAPRTTLPASRTLIRGIAAAGALLAALLALTPEPEPTQQLAAPVPQTALTPAWRPVIRPLPMFNLEGGGLTGSQLSYAANARGDGAREDILSWRPAASPAAAPVGVVVVHRKPPVEVTEQRLFSEIARRAASFGQSLVSAGPPGVIASKFGDLEVMDVRLSGPAGEQACLAFRHVAWSAPFAVSGWRCSSSDKPVDRPSLVCFIDRLTLLSAAQELWLRDYFAESERFRSFCASRRVTAGKVEAKDDAKPALRPDVTGSVRNPKPRARKSAGATEPRSVLLRTFCQARRRSRRPSASC